MAIELPKCGHCGEAEGHWVPAEGDAPGYYTCATHQDDGSTHVTREEEIAQYWPIEEVRRFAARFLFLAGHLDRALWYYIRTERGDRLGDVVGRAMPDDLMTAVDVASGKTLMTSGVEDFSTSRASAERLNV